MNTYSAQHGSKEVLGTRGWDCVLPSRSSHLARQSHGNHPQRVRACVHAYVHVCLRVPVCVHTCEYVCACLSVHVCVRVLVCVRTCVYVVRACVRVCVRMLECTRAYVRAYVCVLVSV